MKFCLLCIVVAFMISNHAYARDVFEKEILPNGKTVIPAHFDETKIIVEIKTHQIDVVRQGDQPPNHPSTNCTYSRIPCSVVDDMRIFINDKEILIPRSVFADLADLDRVYFREEHRGYSLIFDGGDAAGGYNLEILFDNSGVLRRELSNGEFPENGWETTIYAGQSATDN